jgi:hypothetical protein
MKMLKNALITKNFVTSMSKLTFLSLTLTTLPYLTYWREWRGGWREWREWGEWREWRGDEKFTKRIIFWKKIHQN